MVSADVPPFLANVGDALMLTLGEYHVLNSPFKTQGVKPP